jgi:ABC-type transport system involved in multi-copper enzyme maturation permease subunit
VIRSYASEWIRFRKTARVGILVMVVSVVLISLMVLLGSEEMGPGGDGHGGPFGGAADLASNDGAVAALSTSANLIGIVAIALFALSVARDFELGTIRNLLIGQPRRAILLSGKLLALASYLIIGVVAAGVVAALLAVILAPGQDISTDTWTVAGALGTLGTTAIATVLWGLVGAVLAMVTRSAAISITAGVAYLLIIENLLGLIWDSAGEWLPAGVIAAVASGGTDLVSFEKSIVLAVGYAILGLGVMYLTFMRRDITD